VIWRAAFACLVLWPVAAFAQLWGYVDGQGVAHVATTQVDSRYRLVLGGRTTDTSRVSGKADATAGLLTWLEFAPEVKRIQPVLREAARMHGVDIELLKAVIAVESGFNDKAVSPKGALGLMQITPETADRYATKAEAQRPASERMLDPRVNVLTGARMLADLTRRYGRIDVALAAWNAGEGTVRKHGGGMPPIDETRAHVHLVLELYWALLQNNLQRGAHQLRMQPSTAP
jgi:soluble lytic murein transglycosylase-like protein